MEEFSKDEWWLVVCGLQTAAVVSRQHGHTEQAEQFAKLVLKANKNYEHLRDAEWIPGGQNECGQADVRAGE